MPLYSALGGIAAVLAALFLATRPKRRRLSTTTGKVGAFVLVLGMALNLWPVVGGTGVLFVLAIGEVAWHAMWVILAVADAKRPVPKSYEFRVAGTAEDEARLLARREAWALSVHRPVRKSPDWDPNRT